MAPVAAAVAAAAKTSSYYGCSWFVLCEDDTSDTGNKVVVPPLCSPLLFYLNLLNSSVADEMDWHCDMMLHL
jgi:hypothetical protein